MLGYRLLATIGGIRSWLWPSPHSHKALACLDYVTQYQVLRRQWPTGFERARHPGECIRLDWSLTRVLPMRVALAMRNGRVYSHVSHRFRAKRLWCGLIHCFLRSSAVKSVVWAVDRCVWMLLLLRNGHVSGDMVVRVGRLRASCIELSSRTPLQFSPCGRRTQGVRSGSCVAYLN